MHASLLSAFGAELQKLGELPRTHTEGALDLGGLGVLAVPSALQLAGKGENPLVAALAHGAPKAEGMLMRGAQSLAHGYGEPAMEIGGLGLLAAPVISNMVRSSKEAADPAHEAEEQQVMGLMQQALDLLASGQNEQAAALIHEALQRFYKTEEAEVGPGALQEGAPVQQEPEGMVTTASALPGFFQELMKAAMNPTAVGAGLGAGTGLAAAGMWNHGSALQDQGMVDANFITPEEHQKRQGQRMMGMAAAGGAALGHYAPSIYDAGVDAAGKGLGDVMSPTTDAIASKTENAIERGMGSAAQNAPGRLMEGVGELAGKGTSAVRRAMDALGVRAANIHFPG